MERARDNPAIAGRIWNINLFADRHRYLFAVGGGCLVYPQIHHAWFSLALAQVTPYGAWPHTGKERSIRRSFQHPVHRHLLLLHPGGIQPVYDQRGPRYPLLRDILPRLSRHYRPPADQMETRKKKLIFATDDPCALYSPPQTHPGWMWSFWIFIRAKKICSKKV